jgi:hypothetical protein
MRAKEATTHLIGFTGGMLQMFIGDFSEADMTVRPAPGANCAAWQIGHLIASEVEILKAEVPAYKPVELPPGFIAAHDTDAAKADPPRAFFGRQQYIDLFKKVRAATLALTGELPDEALDQPTSANWRPLTPKIGNLLNFMAVHDLMHFGQLTVIRRKLGKPVLM